MAETKRYYWLRLMSDFFQSKRIKKLRRQKCGDTKVLIYLKLQLLAMRSNGLLKYTGLEQSMADELALDIEEDETTVAETLEFLMACGLCECTDGINYFFPYSVELVGSETSAAARMRNTRKNSSVTDGEQCSRTVEQCSQHGEQCYGEKEIEKEIEIDTIDIDINNSLSLPLVSGKAYAIPETNLKRYQITYPDVDVLQQLREMQTWLYANPKKMKTERGIESFINRWLAKQQSAADKLHNSKAYKMVHHNITEEELASHDADIEALERDLGLKVVNA